MIRFEGVSKSFGHQKVLVDVTGIVPRGDIVIVCGPSGSGKTTLIRTVNRLETVDAGRVIVDGHDVGSSRVDINKLRTSIGFVFQQYNLFPHLSAIENITIGPIKNRGMQREAAFQLGRDLLESVGLAGLETASPSALSGGQRQRVAIARALAMEPSVLLLDEPTSALDPEAVADVLTAMRKLTSRGITTLCVTHEMGFARDVATEIWFMDRGRIVEQATPSDFFSRPKHTRTKQFLAEILRV